MSVRVDGMTIHIEGNSPVEDAEPLLSALQRMPDATVDLSRATRLHSASVQILRALAPPTVGSPSDPFQASFVFPLLSISDGGKELV
ncbi:hypothetical protein sphantq_00703 [Sphingobium sp. AntQ-1]|uniref:STAS domain-containing protein n=1 Tax=Sphingomonas bisphenolicum TaxID=296544 RepID=A0ABM7G0K6_9SPHN|nr:MULTISPECIES: hypothetical protein [Sphingomonadaceae]WCP12306.1 hypothetical protein sphantq_00703 [Sphingobium sp. AntQ-1]BBF70897.1 hypothetical protein SBA_ch1_30970 [Sphingomonas bisphenolicum]